MSWSHFSYFAVAAILLWTTGAYAAWRNKPRTAYGATVAGLVVFFAFIVGLWISLERPPLRTMGETRLWYSFFLPLTGIIVYGRWHYKWILSFSTMMALVFVCINLFKPEIHSKTLMPALQSPWFAPHVIVYMFAYALLGASMVMAIYLLFFKGRFKVTERGSVKQPGRYRCGGFRAKLSGTYQPPAPQEMDITDNLVNGGLAFMTFGMLFGALWAKEAWGHYWAWDPKETWAAVTWFCYLGYIHYRRLPQSRVRVALWLLIVGFVLLQICWWGINYLPSAQGASVHTYNAN